MRKPTKLLLFLLGFAAGCGRDVQTVAPPLLAASPVPEVNRVLVVVNDESPDSMEVGAYYAKRRSIPAGNVLHIRTSTDEQIAPERYKTEIETPVRSMVESGEPFDYIVLTLGVPIQVENQQGYSVDALLAGMDLSVAPLSDLKPGMSLKNWENPYFNSDEPFSHKNTNTYIVARLIGYDVQDCKKLIDDSLSALATKGPFLMAAANNRAIGEYGKLQATLQRAAELLSARGYDAQYDDLGDFPAPSQPLAGYCSWGSNDHAFKGSAYRRLRFLPGALAQTFVSTSARTFHHTTLGQSLIADLIAQGVTGVAGYVSEPYAFALARPDILFDRYTRGFNLGESFAAASPIVKWKEIIVGDPLCRPYESPTDH